MSDAKNQTPAPEPSKTVCKRVTFEMDDSGQWTSEWEHMHGAGPVTHRELNQLNRSLIVGFRNHLRGYRKSARRDIQPTAAPVAQTA